MLEFAGVGEQHQDRAGDDADDGVREPGHRPGHGAADVASHGLAVLRDADDGPERERHRDSGGNDGVLGQVDGIDASLDDGEPDPCGGEHGGEPPWRAADAFALAPWPSLVLGEGVAQEKAPRTRSKVAFLATIATRPLNSASTTLTM